MNKTDIKNLPRLYTDEEIANTTEIEFFYISCLYGGRGGYITDPEQIRIIMEGCRIGDTELSEGGILPNFVQMALTKPFLQGLIIIPIRIQMRKSQVMQFILTK